MTVAPMSEAIHRPWTRAKVIEARPDVIARARTLDALLVIPLGVLPQSEGDPIRVFEVGIDKQMAARLRADAVSSDLSRAIQSYVHSFAYRLAMAQPGSVRHDIDGNVVEEVRPSERQLAQQMCQAIITRTRERRARHPSVSNRSDDALA